MVAATVGLRVRLTSFVGRQAAMEELGGLLARHRLVSLVGPGGSGKTRLALEVADRSHADSTGSSWFVDLAGVARPEDVVSAVLAALGIRPAPGGSQVDTLMANLASVDALVIMDTCEHVADEVCRLVEMLLRHCPRLVVVATSREPLLAEGEVVWRVPPLAPPDESTHVDPNVVLASEAAQLFVERAGTAQPGFMLAENNATAVAEICRRLDGLPLAIELAAAQVAVMSVARIADGLSGRFGLLGSRRRTAPARHRTLDACIDWSVDLLSERERKLLGQLSVFSGGFTIEGAEAVGEPRGDPTTRSDVLGRLTALVDKSLVQVDADGERYRLLDTIRDYAGRRLATSDELAAARSRHLEHFARLAADAEARWWTPDLRAWIDRLTADRDNVRAALAWSLESDQVEVGAATLAGVSYFMWQMAAYDEGLEWCEQFLDRPLSDKLRAELWYWAANFVAYSDPGEQHRYGALLADWAESVGDDRLLARGLAQRAGREEPQLARRTLEAAVAAGRRARDAESVVDALGFISVFDMAHGRFAMAVEHAREAVEAAREYGYSFGEGFALTMLMEAALYHGAIDLAADAANRLGDVASLLGNPYLVRSAQLGRGTVAMYRSDESAGDDLEAARRWTERHHDYLLLPSCTHREGELAVALGEYERACRILEDALPVADRYSPPDAALHRCLLAEACLRSGDLSRARWWIEQLKVPTPWMLAAKSRLEHASGDIRRAWSLACDGAVTANHIGAQLVDIDLLELLAVIAADSGQPEEAARLFGAAESQRSRLGYVRFWSDCASVVEATHQIDAAIGVTERSRCWTEGAALTVDEAVAYARRGRGPRRRPTTGWASLTPTEQRLVELVIGGASNADVAAAMFVSPATVKTHLSHVYAKLGVSNRRELVSLASVRSTGT